MPSMTVEAHIFEIDETGFITDSILLCETSSLLVYCGVYEFVIRLIRFFTCAALTINSYVHLGTPRVTL